MILKLLNPGTSKNGKQTQDGPQGKFGLMNSLRILDRSQHVNRRLMHVRRYRPWVAITLSNASAAGWVWRQEA